MHDGGRTRDVHALLAGELARDVGCEEVGEVVAAQVAEFAPQHLHHAHLLREHLRHRHRNPSVPEVHHSYHFSLIPILPQVPQVGRSDTGAGADQGVAGGSDGGEGVGEGEAVGVVVALEDGDYQFERLVLDEVLEVGVGDEHPAQHEEEGELGVELLDGGLVGQFGEDGAVVALAEGVVVVLAEFLEGGVVELEACEQRDVHEALVGGSLVDEGVTLLQEQAVVHRDRLPPEVHAQPAVPYVHAHHRLFPHHYNYSTPTHLPTTPSMHLIHHPPSGHSQFGSLLHLFALLVLVVPAAVGQSMRLSLAFLAVRGRPIRVEAGFLEDCAGETG